MSLDVTVTDLFCGAGGSSIGAETTGARLRMAANHWSLAIETHNANFPDADHDCADVSQVDPRRYPSTTVLLASPECTHHSQARSQRHSPNLFDPKGDPAAERSRATMWDVVRFAEVHHYELVVVENVCEVRRWLPWDAWLAAMDSLGYQHRVLYLNSMVAHPTPQSRDRLYVVFWRAGNPAPDLDFRPKALCPDHGDVEAVQTWKRADRPGGKYRQQYLYRCPRCHGVATPYAWPAASAIDWSLPCPRIGDRARPLAEATLRRIRVGLDRYGPSLVQRSGHTYERPGSGYVRAWPVDGPMPTQTTEPHHGLVVPTHHGQDGPPARPVWRPWPARPSALHRRAQTGRQEHALRGGASDARPVTDPLATVCASGQHHALVVRNFGDGGDPSMTKPVTSPFGTVTTRDHHSLLSLPFLTSYYGTGGTSSASEPVPTVTTRDRHGLVEPNGIEVEDCGFRMLEPHEIGKAMAFPDDYTVTGNKRQRVRQYGNAVTPPVMAMILSRAIGTLA